MPKQTHERAAVRNEGSATAPDRSKRSGKSRRLRGERIVIEAEQEIELRCGQASITLLADGTILLKGVNVLNQALKINKIRGAAVRIN